MDIERLAKLEVEVKMLKSDISELKKSHAEIMKRLSNIELKIALYTGGIIALITALEHIAKFARL